jgi:hypothetical protein
VVLLFTYKKPQAATNHRPVTDIAEQFAAKMLSAPELREMAQ